MTSSAATIPTGATRPSHLPPDLAFWAAALALANLPLLLGHPALELVFRPDAVAAGQWWRLLTHPFVHVGPYHLLMDGGAFLILYPSLPGGLGRRLAAVAGAAAGALAATLLLDPRVGALGLCGLSGVDHGLMAAWALGRLRAADDRAGRWAGAAALGLVAAKAVFEAATGGGVFAGWHLGAVGVPLGACHLGGVAGALAVGCLGGLRHRPVPPAPPGGGAEACGGVRLTRRPAARYRNPGVRIGRAAAHRRDPRPVFTTKDEAEGWRPGSRPIADRRCIARPGGRRRERSA